MRTTAVWALLTFLSQGTAFGQSPLREGFEGPQPSWRFAGADAPYRVLLHQRVAEEPHGGATCEMIQFFAGDGSSLRFAHDTGEARIIDELSVALWVRCDRPGPQLFGRVVLPRSVDPRTGKPATLQVPGGRYTTPGAWQQLRLNPLPLAVQRQTRALRAELGPAVDAREAYLDGVFLNAWAGAGQTRLWIDDLEIAGRFVGDHQEAPPAPQEIREPAAPERQWTPPGQISAEAPGGFRVDLQGAQLMVDGQPFFPRIVQGQGEPLEFLRDLGFNVVRLRSVPTEAILADARRLGMWLVVPPPISGDAASQLSPPTIDERWDAVLAWDLGENLAEEDFDRIRRLAETLRRADSRRRRPLVGDALSDVRAFRRRLDILRPFRFPLGSTFEWKDYAAWLGWRPRLAPGSPIWTVVQTQPSWSLREQSLAFSPTDPPPHLVPSEQIRLGVWAALGAEVRGLEFESQSRLDDNSPEARYRALALESVNLQLRVIEPWLTTGARIDTVVSTSHPEAIGGVLGLERARLFLPAWWKPRAQYATGQSAANDVVFVVPGVPESYVAYEVTPVGLRRLSSRRVTRGMQISLEEFDVASMVLFTENHLVLTATSRRVAETARRAAELEREIAAQRLRITGRLAERLRSAGEELEYDPAWLRAAQANLTRCDRALQQGSLETAWREARRAQRPLRILERTHWERALEDAGPASNHPLAASPWALPAFLASRGEMERMALAPNRLAGGDCEDLQRMLSAGWRHFEHNRPGATSAADLAADDPRSGRFSLRLRVAPEDAEAPPEIVETPPIWVTSAPTPVARGTLVRISGWVRVPAPITGSADGLLIIDSLGGPSLAQRVGQTGGWQPFTIYRAAPKDDELTVTFALTGLGQAWIDDVTVEPLVPRDLSATRPRRTQDYDFYRQPGAFR